MSRSQYSFGKNKGMEGKNKKYNRKMEQLYNWKLAMWIVPVACAFIGGLVFIIANVRVHKLETEISVITPTKNDTTYQ